MNKTIITVTGNLGTTPEIRLTPRGTPTARLRLAATERKRQLDGTWTDGDTTWHTVIAWGPLAEATTELTKGAPLIIHGRLAHRSFTDTTGADREVWEITAETIGTTLRTVGRGAEARSRDHDEVETEQEQSPRRSAPLRAAGARPAQRR